MSPPSTSTTTIALMLLSIFSTQAVQWDTMTPSGGSEVTKCLLTSDLQYRLEEGMLYWTDTQIRNFCKNWQTLLPCVKIEPGSLNLTNLLQGSAAEIGRLQNICGHRYSAYVSSYDCLKETNISAGVQRCIRIGVKTSNHLLPRPESKREACLRILKTSDCVNKYSIRCGPPAMAFVSELLDKYLASSSHRLTTRCDHLLDSSLAVSSVVYNAESSTAKACTETYTEKKLDKCVKLVHPEVSLNQLVNFTGPLWTLEQLNIMCRNLHLYKPCPERIFESCDNPRLRVLGKVARVILDYVCREGFKVYLRVFTCLHTDSTISSILHHTISHASSMDAGEEFYFNGEYNEEKICQYNEDMSHYGDYVAHICGFEARHFLVELATRTVNPYSTVIKCSTYNTGAIIGITIGCVVLVLAVLAVRYAQKKQLITLLLPRVQFLKTTT